MIPGRERSRDALLWAVVALASAIGAVALLAVTLPGSIRLVLTLYVVLFWPGLAATVMILRRADLTVVDFLALSLPASAGVIAAEGFVAYALHPPMRSMLYFHTAIAGALSAAALASRWLNPSARVTAERISPRFRIILDCAALALIVGFAVAFWPTGTFVGPDLREGIDTWFHLGQMAKLAYAERISAGCAFFQGAGPDSRYPFSASHMALGLLAGFARLPLLTVWAGLARTMPLLALAAVYFFVKEVFSHRYLALAILALCAGTAFACEPYAAPYFPLLWGGADAKDFAAYPYPNLISMRIILPCVAALVAAYLRQPGGPLMVLLALVVFGAGAWHVMGLLWVPLFATSLLCVCALARTGAGAALRIFALCCAMLLPSAVLTALSHPVHLPPFFQGKEVIRLIAGERFFVVMPHYMLMGTMIGAALTAAAVLLTGAQSPSVLVAAASVLLVPLINLNPLAVSALGAWTSYYSLWRLYEVVPPAFFCMASIVAIPVALGRVYEWATDRRSLRLKLCAAIAGIVAFLAAFPLLDSLQRFIWFWVNFPSDSIAGPLLLGSAMLALPIARGVFHRRIAGLRLLPHSRWGNVIMIAAAGTMVTVRALALLGPEPWAGGCREKKNALTRWPLDPVTGAPRFLLSITHDAPAFSTTVYSSDPFAAELVPAFAHQFTLYYDENANPRVDLGARKRAHAAIGDPNVPLDKTVGLLRRFAVHYVVTTKYTPSADAKFRRRSAAFAIIYRDESARVYRLAR